MSSTTDVTETTLFFLCTAITAAHEGSVEEEVERTPHHNKLETPVTYGMQEVQSVCRWTKDKGLQSVQHTRAIENRHPLFQSKIVTSSF